MASRDLSRLVPKLRTFAPRLIGEAWDKYRLKLIITNVERDILEQSALYAQGRRSLADVNALRAIAKMPPISEKENSYCVTWTMKSKHIVDLHNESQEDDLSRAFDFAVLSPGGSIIWSIKADVNKDNFPDYMQVGALAMRMDPTIVWGGKWKTPDYCHIQDK
jgi:hypothetical protein